MDELRLPAALEGSERVLVGCGRENRFRIEGTPWT